MVWNPTLLGLFAQATDASHAAHGAHHSLNWVELAGLFLNAILFFGGLLFIARKKVKQALEERHQAMAQKLKEAHEKQAQAERQLSEYEGKLARLEEEVERIVKAFAAEGEAERVRLRTEADRAVERLSREIDFTIRQESLKAEREIRAAAVDATVTMTHRLILERMTDADRRRLADDYIAEILPQTPSLAARLSNNPKSGES